MTVSEATRCCPCFSRPWAAQTFLAGLLPSSAGSAGWRPQFFAAERMQRLSRFLHRPVAGGHSQQLLSGHRRVRLLHGPYSSGAGAGGLFRALYGDAGGGRQFGGGPYRDRGAHRAARRPRHGAIGAPRRRRHCRLPGRVRSQLRARRTRGPFPPPTMPSSSASRRVGFALAIVSLMRVKEAPAPVRPREISFRDQLAARPA